MLGIKFLREAMSRLFKPAPIFIATPEGITRGLTVPDVFREMRVEPDKQKTWAVGQMAVHHFKQKTGQLPPKDLRVKTCGEGVHCFAIYPEWMRPFIRECILKVDAEPQRQRELFDEVQP